MKVLSPLLLSLLCAPLLAGCNVEVEEKSGEVQKIKIGFSGESGVTVKGSGQVSKETRPLTAVSVIESYGPVDIDIAIGDKPSMEVEADSNLLSHIKTEVKDNKLTVKLEPGVNGAKSLRVRVVTPALANVSTYGSGDMNISQLKGGDLTVESKGSGDLTLAGRVDKFAAKLQGSGDLKGSALQTGNVVISIMGSGDAELATLDAEQINVDIKGSGSVTAQGKAKQLKASIFGSGDIDLAGLASKQAELEIFGAGDINANVTEAVKAEVRGVGTISIQGNPPKREVSGKGVEFL